MMEKVYKTVIILYMHQGKMSFYDNLTLHGDSQFIILQTE